ncbi:HNH endonuclease [Cupriavidus alkaliphilus]|uniref:HNH endonuclease n=1 Tax=Cupriavidus alkaliphilus TaxID=942866 RepID=UPI001A9C92F9|nr:HNH endonuclease [Cupriavidus alkaliphilus]
MSESTALISANSARHLLRGERYRRTLNGALTRGLLERIHRETGEAGLKLALTGLAAHIAYFEETVSPTPQQRALHAEFTALIRAEDPSAIPQEVTNDEASYPEGSVEQVLVNKYERNRAAREACIAAHGSTCAVCSFNFEAVYGELGKGFIHVHHLVEISSIGTEYSVNPVADMRPVCPNCHAMLHKERPALSVEALKAKLRI